MTEIRIKDVFPVTNGIMSAISSTGGYTFSNDIDLRLIATCGQRSITPTVELLLNGATTLSNDLLERLAELILSEYKEAWDKIKDTLTMEYNPLSASQYHEEETTDAQGENTDSSTDVKQDAVSTADVLPDNFISDGKTTNDTKASGTSKNTSKRILTRTSNSTSYKPVDLIKSEIDMRIQNKFTSRVLEDVKNYIAMPIY